MSARVRAVIVGYGCGPHLARALDAWEKARAFAEVEGETVVVSPDATATVDGRVIDVAADDVSTPGANRNRGAAGADTEFLLFLDGDVELSLGFVARALARLAAAPRLAGFGGRLDERHWKDGRVVGEAHDLYRVGRGGPVPYLAQAWMCRRAAFEEVGGFDARLPAEEDFELGARLRRAGWSLEAEPDLAGVHNCPPRPSLAELARRWKNGMFAGPGLALRLARGGATFPELMARQRLYLAALAYALLGALAFLLTLAGRPLAFTTWILGLAAMWLALAVRKGSLRLAALSLLTWTVQGVALARVWLFGPWGTMQRGPR